ncbi:DNA polymerase/3'-5' exonuclease PolX [Chitinophaga costaii]|nr:DNA polymerase/3'-5' exonuclease PolX [Chitinophaga costaii]PUZ30602.1 DNA polymerase/3'-5' exonuclease PolX [Chitinophaga costaii]
MDNRTIADNFSLLSKLMDIHGENSFKAKSFGSAAFTIEKLPLPLDGMPLDDMKKLKGIGESLLKNIQELLLSGRLPLLDNYIEITPPGILEMMKIKGLGPKKIATIWKELEIESLGELLYACNENRLTLLKGFGEKTQDSVRENIGFYMANRERFLYAQVETFALDLEKQLRQLFSPATVSLTGHFRRQETIIDEVELVIALPIDLLEETLVSMKAFSLVTRTEALLILHHEEKVKVKIYSATEDSFTTTLFHTTASPAFLNDFHAAGGNAAGPFHTEEAIFEKAGIAYLHPALREGLGEVGKAKGLEAWPELIQPGDIKGIIHAHSTWSDGRYDLEQMAVAAAQQGFEYLVISDHSRTAVYANGLSIERIQAQHAQIQELNQRLAPFRIFKSIESDILGDGSLDYPNEVLASFDLVIASVHANLKMTEDKAMARLIKAIENPYTTILGHLTGRLLLSRNGYPVDHDKIIDACRANNVVIELNAHPRRLDMDWRYIAKALDKGCLISIDPDAHSIEGFADIRYGVLAAQKGGLTKQYNLSSFSAVALEAYLKG